MKELRNTGVYHFWGDGSVDRNDSVKDVLEVSFMSNLSEVREIRVDVFTGQQGPDVYTVDLKLEKMRGLHLFLNKEQVEGLIEAMRQSLVTKCSLCEKTDKENTMVHDWNNDGALAHADCMDTKYN